MNIRPIKNDSDHEWALGRIDQLMDADSVSPQAGAELDVLITLVDAYESEHHEIEAPDPIEAINFRMEQSGLTRKDLEVVFGTRARVSEILNDRRCLTLAMIRKLHFDFSIPFEALITPNECNHPDCAREVCHRTKS